ncbi:MAG: BON domain-containing protein [Betaproteobacteria bacterium]
MNPRDIMTRQVRAALERETRINLHRYPVRIDSADDVVTLEGEVADIAAKKLALEAAAGVKGVGGIIDRLRVAPGQRRGDGAIRDSVARRFLEAAEFRNCTLRTYTNNGATAPGNSRTELLRQGAGDSVGDIEISVTEGVVVLEGRVISQPHRLFAGVLAWWTPGRLDVLNALEVDPHYETRDDEVTETLRLVLEADPLVDASQITPLCEHWVATLEGSVPTDEQRRRAELDAWYLSGVHRVNNNLQVAS